MALKAFQPLPWLSFFAGVSLARVTTSERGWKIVIHSGKLRWQWNINHFDGIFSRKRWMGIFHCHLSLTDRVHLQFSWTRRGLLLFVRSICVDVYNLWIEEGEVQGIYVQMWEMTVARPLKTIVFSGGSRCVCGHQFHNPPLSSLNIVLPYGS